MALLEVDGLIAGYAEGTVLHGVDFDVEQGGAVAILGRNGVGKSTFLMTLMGLVRPRGGSIRFDGTELAGRRPDAIAREGIALVPQGRRVFAPLTVTEHLDLASSRARRPEPWTIERILELFPRLAERTSHLARQLSGGEQQMLALARALLTNPRLLLLDEPSEGLAPAVVRQVEQALAVVRSKGMTVVIVEQDLHLAFAVAQEVRVMDKGRFVHGASTEAFRRDGRTARNLLGIAGE
ncbi:MAG: ABC transporter ATP-binding protein [Solirubrobacteraceae bacterium]